MGADEAQGLAHRAVLEGRACFRAGAGEGVAVGIPFCLAFLGVGAVFRVAGLGVVPAGLSTLLLLSGPAQVAVAEGVRDHQPLAALLLAVCVINGRYFVMSAALAPYFHRATAARLLVPWSFLSTTTFAGTCAAVRRPGTAAHPLAYLCGLCAVSVPAAVAGTVAGYYGTDLLPGTLRATADMISPIYFMTLLAREWPRGRPLLAGGLGLLLTPVLDRPLPGLGLLLASLAAGLVLGLARPGEGEEKHGGA